MEIWWGQPKKWKTGGVIVDSILGTVKVHGIDSIVIINNVNIINNANIINTVISNNKINNDTMLIVIKKCW